MGIMYSFAGNLRWDFGQTRLQMAFTGYTVLAEI